ncbi:hypothetical protein BGZ92_011056, partial [Podila epicladia]
PPQPADRWFAEHQATCGGTYTKISEPEPKKKPAVKKSATNTEQVPRTRTMLDDFLAGTSKSSSPRLPSPIPVSKANVDIKYVASSSSSGLMVSQKGDERPSAREAASAAALVRFEKNQGASQGRDSGADVSKNGDAVIIPDEEGPPQKRVKTKQGIANSRTNADSAEQISAPSIPVPSKVSRLQSPEVSAEDVAVMVECPVCGSRVAEAAINDHVDLCIWRMNGGDI